jgi:glycosyltransferase involved in cell wall biosynthesis
MKICYIADGSSIHTQRWLNYFAGKGHEVHLIYWKVRPGYDKSICIHFLKRFAPQIWTITRYISFLQWIFRVRKLIKEIKPDVVDAHFIIDNGLLGALSGFHPFVATGWGSDILVFPQRNFIWKIVARFVLKRADKIFCNSDYIKERTLLLGAELNKVSRINHGADINKFNPNRTDKLLKKKLGIGDCPVVISVRHLRPIYNVEMLIKAIPLVLEKIPQTHFIIGSDGEQRSYLEKLATEIGAKHGVIFIGYISHDDIPVYLASSDVYVSTSRSDSSSQSLQEAMASGLAVVVTDLPTNREWITDGENGFIVPKDDHRALAEKIVYLIENDKARVEKGKRSRKFIEDNDDYIKEMGKVEKLYKSLISTLKNTKASKKNK